jgi:hypothetical protein
MDWLRSGGSVAVVVTRLWVWMTEVRFLAGSETFLFITESRPAMGPAQWTLGTSFPGGSSEQDSIVRLLGILGTVPQLPRRFHDVVFN